ncbi:MAG: HlyD family secretion protein [Rhodospirillaceae bacterium]|nr:HlyD family secretion protein [Rhodospirillaceae bacterium]
MKDDAIDIAAADAIADIERGSRRKKLMMLAPLVLVLAAVAYMLSGRYVSTDNAFVRADIADISPEVAGVIQAVLVHDNDVIKAGQPLVKIDSTNYDILLAASDTQLKRVAADIDAERARYHQSVEELAAARSQLEFAQRQFERQSRLAAASAGAEATRDSSQNALKVARANVAVAESKIKESLAELFGDSDIPLENHPAYQQAIAQREVAALQVKRSTILAPFDGVVSHVPQVGDYARTGVTLLSVVSNTNVWVEANFKETEITYMKNGQDAEIAVDAYPGQVWHAHINSLSQATGSEFALLPAQNATGNWVKVVQRVPVRLFIDKPGEGPTLRAGMSVEATVDTGFRRLARWLGA